MVVKMAAKLVFHEETKLGKTGGVQNSGEIKDWMFWGHFCSSLVRSELSAVSV